MRTLAVLVLLIVQAAQPRPAALHGHVTRAGSGASVAHARIVAAKVGGGVDDYRTAVTDANGRFAFDGITPGTYRIHATRDGYLQAEFGRTRAGTSGIPVVIAEGQTSSDLEVVMTPAGVIAGRVFRKSGPVSGAWVRALKSGYVDGERTWSVADWTQTDDRGEYRLFGLVPGSYVVSAVPRARPVIDGASIVTPTVPTNANGNARTERADLTLETLTAAAVERTVYPAAYYPGTLDLAAAQPVEVGPGATVAGIDVAVLAVEPVHVRGRVSLADADAPRSISVALQPADVPYSLPVASARADGAGSFDIAGVPPGRYYVSAQANGTPTLYDLVPLDVVDRDPPPLSITLRRGTTIQGRLAVDGGGIAPGQPPLYVQLRGASARGTCCGAARVAEDGSFHVDNVIPNDYRLRIMPAGRGFWIKSARFGGEDVLAGPLRVPADLKGRELEIELGVRTAALDALVIDGHQRPGTGVLVIAVPAAERRHDSSAYRSGTTGGDGRARIEGLAPGEYTLFASDSVEAAAWQDPAVLRRYEARGTAVSVREGETRTITVKITP